MNDRQALEAFRRRRGLLAADDVEAWLQAAGLDLSELVARIRSGRTEDLVAAQPAPQERPAPERPAAMQEGEVAPPQVWMRRPGTCGAAALLVVLRVLRVTPPAGPLVGPGASLDEIVSVARELGLPATAAKASRARLEELSRPFVAHVDGVHWIVVHRVEAASVVISDPARGAGRLSRAAFEARWTGWCALFGPAVQSH